MALRVDDVDLVRDRALVERFQEGDQAAFDTLYVRYFARLARFCQKRVGDPHEAEEIAQEAFTRALGALPTFEGERRFYPWMTVIAGRLCVDAHRRRGRSEPSSHIDLGVIEGGQEKIVDAVDVQILATALGRITPRHREVLDFREQQGWSYQQIADHYEVTLGTVEALLFRARKSLKREFMAVVGGDRNWVALPVVGGAFGRVASFKAKVEAWVAGVMPALSGPAMAAALAVTAVTGAAVGVGVIHGHRADSAARPAAVLSVAGTPSSAIGPSLPELLSSVGDGSPSAGVAPAAVVAPPRSADDTEGQTGLGGDAPAPILTGEVQRGVEGVDVQEGETRSRDTSVQADVGPVVLGASPEQVTSDLTGSIVNYVEEQL